jgi:hydrogenase maturation protein HypF
MIMSVAPMMRALALDLRKGIGVAALAGRVHETLSRMLSAAAFAACDLASISTVAISGGCFANQRLRRRTIQRLEHRGLRVLAPDRVPCGDRGIALGQAVAASAMLEQGCLDRREV